MTDTQSLELVAQIIRDEYARLLQQGEAQILAGGEIDTAVSMKLKALAAAQDELSIFNLSDDQIRDVMTDSDEQEQTI